MNLKINLSKFIFFIFLLFLPLITSCHSERETLVTKETFTESKESKFKTITLLHYFSGPLSGGIDDLVLDFNQNQETYRLKSIPINHEAFKISSVQTLEEVNPPELYSYWAGAKTIAIKDKLLPLDEVWAACNLDAIFQDAVIQSASQIDGHYYMLPITQHYVSFYYNKHVFESLSLSPPKTWSEFLTVCEILKSNDITPIGLGSKSKWPSQFWFDYLLLRTAGLEYRNDLMMGKAHYTDPEVETVFKLWNELVQNQYFNEDALITEWSETPLASFAENKTAMTLMGTWVIHVFQTDYGLDPENDFGYFTFPIIDESIPLTAIGPIDGFVIPKDSVYTEGALEAIGFLSSASSQAAMAIGSGAFSPSNEVSKSIYLPLQQEILKDIETQSSWAFNYDLATPPNVSNIGLNLFNEFLAFPEHYDLLLIEAENKISKLFND